MDWSSIFNCCDATTLVIGGLVILVVYFIAIRRRHKNFPPGPLGLPLFGYAPFIGKNPVESLMKLKDKYGPVMSIRMGSEDWVVLNDYDTIIEALVNKGEIFSGRPNSYIFQVLSGGYGIAAVDYGPIWKSLRKFGLMTLRGCGVGKKSMEENVREETNILVDNLLSKITNTLRAKITFAVSNIIGRIVFGSRFEYDDQRFKELTRLINEFFSNSPTSRMLGLMIFAPGLRHLPIFRGAMDHVVKDIHKVLEILGELVDEHKSTYDSNDLRDFTDAFLKKIKEKRDSDKSFNDKHLLQYIRDLFEAGSATTSSTLLWCIFCFAHRPETQEKMAEEVERVIGNNGIPTMNHRENMPYTCAFIHEIMRVKTLIPLSVFHKTNDDSLLHGYRILKNTTIIPNIWAVHNDPIYFPNPEEFRPERFLDKSGKFVKSDHVIPFSVGPRDCIGKQLARMEVFIFLTSLVQKLRVAPAKDKPLPPFDSGVFNGLTYESVEFEVNFEKR